MNRGNGPKLKTGSLGGLMVLYEDLKISSFTAGGQQFLSIGFRKFIFTDTFYKFVRLVSNAILFTGGQEFISFFIF